MVNKRKFLMALLAIILSLSMLGGARLDGGQQVARAHPLLIELAAENPDQLAAVIVQKQAGYQGVEQVTIRLGGNITKDLGIINAFAAQMPVQSAVRLAQEPGVRWVSLDAPVVEVSGVEDRNSVHLRADFNVPTFADGASRWDQVWQEIGEEDGADNGDVAITSFLGGSLQGVRLQGASKGIQSSVDLSLAESAILSFGFRRKGFESEEDFIAVEISTDGGNEWVQLDRLAGPATDPTLSFAQYDLSQHVPGQLTLRFVSSAVLSQTSKFYIDFAEIEFVTSPKPELDLPYRVLLPLVATFNANAQTNSEMGYASQLAVEYDFSESVRDEFNTGTFAGNDGSATWMGGWVEDDVAGIGTTGGNVNILNGELRLADRPDTGTEPSITRGVDLSNAVAAVFSFDYRTTVSVDTSDAVMVEVSQDGGLSYTALQTYTGIAGEVWGKGQFDLTPYLSTQTLVRFRVTNLYGGDKEYFLVDNVQIAYALQLGDTVRDEFNNVAYDNSDGSQHWAEPWVEYDPYSSGGATSGYVRVNPGGKLTFYYLWGEYITRKVNLSGSDQAILSFDWQTAGLDEGEALSVLVSKDGISQFVELDAFGGTQSGSRRYDLTPYISANTTVKFGNSGQFWDWGEYAYIDNVQVTFQSPCPDCFNTTNNESTFVQSIGADVLWNEGEYLQGQGVTVAVVDSGIAPHMDLADASGQSRILAQVAFLSENNTPDDFYGHGTHVAGTIGGNGHRSNNRYPGVAPQVNLVDVKVMDDRGIGTTSDVIAGLQWIYENKDQYNIRVVNMSLNSTVAESYHSSPLDAALEILWFNGIAVVVSAGNNGNYDGGVMYPPANDPFVITVGAVDDRGSRDTSDDTLASFSAYGITSDGSSKPDLVVPGRNIISALASDDCNLIIDHPDHAVKSEDGVYYFRMSGTSMASAVGAGAVALLLQADPNLSPDQVKQRLMATAGQFGSGNQAGYLNIYSAVHSETNESANTGLTASQLLWSGDEPVTWGSVAWNSVAWNSVAWNSVAWNSVAWNSVAWNE